MARPQDAAPTRCGQFHWRTRLCLLKGCARPFRPRRPGSRYCCKECRELARIWSRARAGERYRRSHKGQACRREQSKRYRQRRGKRKQEAVAEEGPTAESEGDHKEQNQGFLCARPGCYERACPTRRSPLRKFCSCLCRQAVRRVLERERRWWRRAGGGFWWRFS